VLGEDGPDILLGQAGDDRLFGGVGNDSLYTGVGADFADGGLGRDLVASDSESGQTSTLRGGAGNDKIVATGPGVFDVEGGSGDDQIKTGNGNDRVEGGSGRDRIVTGKGADAIDVADGRRDEVFCGRGDDTVQADRRDVLHGCETRTVKSSARHRRR
jgi:Ca2+-binding RTX toxin-like protein